MPGSSVVMAILWNGEWEYFKVRVNRLTDGQYLPIFGWLQLGHGPEQAIAGPTPQRGP